MEMAASRDELIYFLKRQVEDGHVPINTGLSRMASVRKVLEVLTEAEAEDVTSLDVDAIIRRFIARSEHQYSLASHVSYKSRLKSALSDFNASLASASDSANDEDTKVSVSKSASVERAHAISIPLARGCTVVIENLPVNLTPAEAERIANVVQAYAIADG